MPSGREAGNKRVVERLFDDLDRPGAGRTVSVRLFAEGDFVVRQEIRDHGMLVDVLRVHEGRCVERWDAFRPDPGTDRLPGF